MGRTIRDENAGARRRQPLNSSSGATSELKSELSLMLNVTSKRFAAWVFAICAVFNSQAADAVVGTVDTQNRFPFVVRLTISFSNYESWCSGSISLGGLVSTAAHCIWDSGSGLARQVLITYRDADGVERTVRAQRIFYPKAFEEPKRGWEAARLKPWTLGSEVTFLRAAREDIAFIVPAERIAVEGYPHWATELLVTDECPISVDEITPDETPPSRCAGRFSEDKFKEELGQLDHARAMAVGYGNFNCINYDERDEPNSCQSDGQRRYAELPLFPRDRDGKIWAPPELWCTTQNQNRVNPIQHGDSGGPLFVRALDGRWLFVGYHSGGSIAGSCASSILRHLDLWREAATYMARLRYPKKAVTGSWEFNQSRRFVDELLESWSGPNEEALRRLGKFYASAQFDELDPIKKRFAENWPVRKFMIQPGSKFTLGGSGEPVNSVEAHFFVSWDVRNPSTGASASGVSGLTLHIQFGYENEMKLVYGSLNAYPRILSEICRSLSGDDALVEFSCPKAIPNAWDYNGSVVLLNGNRTSAKREFYYEKPLDELLTLGVRKGTLLFSGTKNRNSYAGTVHVFSKRCGHRAYTVSGWVSEDQRTVTLLAPSVDNSCKVIDLRGDTLELTFQGD